MLKTTFILTLLSLVSAIVIGQDKYPVLFRTRNIDNFITVPGTHVQIHPPTGFLPATTFTGLTNGSSVIEVYDLPGGSYRVLSDDFTREKFEGQRLQVLDIEDVKVDGSNGRLIWIQHGSRQQGFSLVFGDDKFAVIVVSNFDGGKVGLADAVRESLLGIRYGKDDGDELTSAGFHLDDSRSAFHFDKRSANTFYYRNNSSKDAYLTVTQLAWDYTSSPSTIASLMLGEMTKYGLGDPDVKKKTSRRFNGYQAYESEIYATRKGEKCLVYQLVIVHDSRALAIHGIGTNDTDFRKNKEAFRKLARTVQFR